MNSNSSSDQRPSRASEILAQWRREQQQQQQQRPSMIESTAQQSLTASPMTTASSTGLTLVSDHDETETDIFSEGHSTELDETLVGGRPVVRIHSLQQQLAAAGRQKEQLESTVRRGVSAVRVRLDQLADLCHNLATEQLAALTAEDSYASALMLSPQLRANKRLPNSVDKLQNIELQEVAQMLKASAQVKSVVGDSPVKRFADNRLDLDASFQHLSRRLELDIPQFIHSLQQTVQERVALLQRGMQQTQLQQQRHFSEQLSRFDAEINIKKQLLDSTQLDLDKAKAQLQIQMQRINDLDAEWTRKHEDCAQLTLRLEQRMQQYETMEHEVQSAEEKMSHLTLLESALDAEKEEIKTMRKSLSQQKTLLHQDFKQLQQDTDNYQRKSDELMIVQTELLQLQNVLRAKEDELELQLQTLHQDQTQLQAHQQELDEQQRTLQQREKLYQLEHQTLIEEQEQFSQRLIALEQRERELDDERVAMHNIKAQFAKAVSLAKTEIEEQRSRNDTVQKQIQEEQVRFQNDLDELAKTKRTLEIKITELQIQQTDLERDKQYLQTQVSDLRKDCDTYLGLKQEHLETLTLLEQKKDQTQVLYNEMQLKLSHLSDSISRKEQDHANICQQMNVLEEQHRHQHNRDMNTLKNECNKLCRENTSLQTQIQQLDERLDHTQKQMDLNERDFKRQLECANQREALAQNRLDELRQREEKVMNEEQKLNRRQTQLKETESKLTKIAQILKAKEKAQAERENHEKVSREGDLKDLIVQLREVIEAEKKRFNDLISDKDKLEEDSKAKDFALKQLQDVCLLENHTLPCDDDLLSSPSSAYTQLRQLALRLKQKDDELSKDREFLEEKLTKCSECERRLIEWQHALESLAASLIEKT